MTDPLRLMAIFAHPDDETLGIGATLARYAAEGVETSLVCATRGERGWDGPPETNPGLQALGRLREAELQAAAEALGISRVFFLDAIDGELDQTDPIATTRRIAGIVRSVRPQVVITFAPDGDYGHPDHIAISRMAVSAAFMAAQHPVDSSKLLPHAVSKLYYYVTSQQLKHAIDECFGGIHFPVKSEIRSLVAWPDWAISTRIRAPEFLPAVWKATLSHRSQIGFLGDPDQFPETLKPALMAENSFVRAFSIVPEDPTEAYDLFAGLR
jgi:LmbE family N-acetylglucosaminyl deacetylase